MTKHAHRASNLAKEDVDLVEVFDQAHGSLMLTTFKFACSGSCSSGETLEQESFFLRQSLLHSSLVVWRFDREEMSFVKFCATKSPA